jgi:hypothetical protein
MKKALTSQIEALPSIDELVSPVPPHLSKRLNIASISQIVVAEDLIFIPNSDESVWIEGWIYFLDLDI